MALPTSDTAAPASTRLPNEVIINIIHQMDNTATLARSMRVSHEMYDLAAPILYRDIVVTTKNAKGLYVGLNEPASRTFDSKHKLLSMIRHLSIHALPTGDDSFALTLGHIANPPHQQAIRLSIRPLAVWHLMFKSMAGHSCDDFLAYLRLFKIHHLRVQMPIMDRALDEDFNRNRVAMTRNKLRHKVVQDAMSLFPTDRFIIPSLQNFFDALTKAQCQGLTFHNLTVVSRDIALRPCDPFTLTVQAFFRPCAGADGDLLDKASSGFCFNHPLDGRLDIADGGFTLDREVLSSPQQIDLIDIDWIRGKQNPLREDTELRSIEAQVESQLRGYSEAQRAKWGSKSFKMSNQAEVCKCCGKGQMSASEGSIKYAGPF